MNSDTSPQVSLKYATLEQHHNLEGQLREITLKIDTIIKVQDFVVSELFKIQTGGTNIPQSLMQLISSN